MKNIFTLLIVVLSFFTTKFSAQTTTYLWSNGATTSTINVNPSVTTTYRVTISQNGVDYHESLIVAVNGNPTISGASSVCSNKNTQLSGTGIPAVSNAWVSSNASVATVSSTGLVTGVTAGTVTITYTNSDGCSTTQLITVYPSLVGIDYITSCSPITWIDGNSYTSSNNTATFTIVSGSAYGCDSTVTLNLTILPTATSTTNTTTACATNI